MAIIFPPNPAGQTPPNTFSTTSTPLANTTNGYTYVWNGSAWTSTGGGGGGGGGSVTSVDVSGGTTGLTYSGGPVTTAGTITLAGVLGVANGGTGATSTANALAALLPVQTGQGGKVLGTNGSTTSWVTSGVEIPSGTTMLFAEAAAPAGWVQETGAIYNNSSIRVVTGAGGGSGGTIPFTTLFSPTATYTGSVSITSGQVGDTVLSEAQLASHTHVVNNNAYDFIVAEPLGGRYGPGGIGGFGNGLAPTGSSAVHTHSLIGVAANGNFTSNFAVQYVDVIACTKS